LPKLTAFVCPAQQPTYPHLLVAFTYHPAASRLTLLGFLDAVL